MIYFFKRKYRQVKNILKWLPILWGQFDFDYIYAVDVFKFKLLSLADHFDSDKGYCEGTKDRATRIRMIVRLMEKVYDEDYGMEYQTKLEEIYGKDMFDIDFVSTNVEKENGSFCLKQNYELSNDKDRIDEINKMTDQLFKESKKKQKRAHQLLWKLVEHNIRNWWD